LRGEINKIENRCRVVLAKRYTSNDGKLLNKAEIKEMLMANLPYFSEMVGAGE
jgi:hypothetical protein